MKSIKSASALALCMMLPFTVIAATSAGAEEDKAKKEEGGVVKGAVKGAAAGAILPGVSAKTGAVIGGTAGGVKKMKDNEEKKEDKK